MTKAMGSALTLRMSEEDRKKLDEIARKDHRTTADLARLILRDFVNKRTGARRARRQETVMTAEV